MLIPLLVYKKYGFLTALIEKKYNKITLNTSNSVLQNMTDISGGIQMRKINFFIKITFLYKRPNKVVSSFSP